MTTIAVDPQYTDTLDELNFDFEFSVDTEIVVGATAQSYELQMQWDPGNAAQQAMRTAFDLRANKGFKIQWPDGAHVLFYGTVGYTMAPGGEKQGNQ